MSIFHFKKFSISQSNSTLKVGTDSMLLGVFASGSIPKNGLDIGAGTGVLTLMICQKYDVIHMDAIEIDPNSYSDLELNISNSPFHNRIQCLNIDFFDFRTNQTYDLIISNPPYFEDGIKFDQNLNYHYKHANFFSKDLFFLNSHLLLSLKGLLWIIVPFPNEHKWIESALNAQLYLYKRIEIEAKPHKKVRTILVFSKTKTNQIKEEVFVIRDHDGKYTRDYQELTLEFHNKIPLR